MNTPINSWKSLTLGFTHDLNDALQQQHHAAQLIALVGRHLILQQSDDSNTNMEFVFGEEMLMGNALSNGMRVVLYLKDLNMRILDQKNGIKKEIGLTGKTIQQGFEELKQSLSDLGVDVSNFNNELHYEIPAHQLDQGAYFFIEDENYFLENAKYRHNAKIVLNEVSKLFEQYEPIKIWPHHFDTGAYYVLSKNENGSASKTIGIGWAVPDSMVDEPYYYLSFWSEKPKDIMVDFPVLEAGKWMMPNWNGAVLRHSEIQNEGSAEKQHGLVQSFFTQGIAILSHYLKNS